jgi:ectoine hydroxylase
MQLTSAQLADYQRDGLLFLPALFEAHEVAALKRETARLLEQDLPCHLRAASGEYLGTTAMDRHSALFARLLRDERLLDVAEQLLGPRLYCHQYKVILKQPFGKLSLPWHQDYAPWHHHDGMPAPRALSLGIYLDEVNAFNGPIVYIPGSHVDGLIDYELLEVPGTTPIPSLPDATVARLVEQHGLIAPTGPVGSVTLFDACMAHASGQNLSPWPRHLVYLSYNPVDNAIRKPTRPEHFASRDFTPLERAPRDALLAAA